MIAKTRAFSRWLVGALFNGLVSNPTMARLASVRNVRRAVSLVVLAAAVFFSTLQMSLEDQALFSFTLVLVALLIRKVASPVTRLVLIYLSILLSTRYMVWRFSETLGEGTAWDLTFGLGLLAAEVYAFVVLFLGYYQTAWPLRRLPKPLPSDTTLWPSVDVFIPTYNEPLSVVKPTVLAAMSIDWPKEKLNIYVLDDGRREEFAEFCARVGVTHLTRNNNNHAKAGNINAALQVTQGEFVAIFDCDHIPTRSFLQVCMGWFMGYSKLAMIQTPHHFFSPDPFERNLDTFRKVPNEGELFYGLIQDGNDFWNATFFCGSCAVLRREPLLEVGGIAVETVTEDAHTALKMQRLGYDTAYLAVPQAAGLATESLSGHVGQRIRWARGMAQIFRVDNPLTGKGLKLGQRFCYTNAMMHFFYGLPRLIFLTAPLAFLVFGAHVIQASALEIACYTVPFLVLANTANSHIQGKYRHSFWNEVYETVLAWYILRPTLYAFINPKAGKFNVTPKGGLIEKAYFDLDISRPFLVLLVLNLVGFGFGVYRLNVEVGDEFYTTIINMVWTSYNLLLLGASVLVARESIQRREHPRGYLSIDAQLALPDGRLLPAQMVDFSMGGVGLDCDHKGVLVSGAAVHVVLSNTRRQFALPVHIASVQGNRVGLQFKGLTVSQEINYVSATFARADVWVGSWATAQRSWSFASLGKILWIGGTGMVYLSRYLPVLLINNLKTLFSAGRAGGTKN